MAAAFIDLDGSAFLWGTDAFVPGAYEELRAFFDAGNQLVFVTQRDASMDWAIPLGKTELFLKSLFPGCAVLFGISSPRILLNDAGAVAVNHQTNAPWNYELNLMGS